MRKLAFCHMKKCGRNAVDITATAIRIVRVHEEGNTNSSVVGSSSAYTMKFYVPDSSHPGRLSLRSSSCGDLQAPRFHTSARAHRVLSCIGQSYRNSLPLHICGLLHSAQCSQHFKTVSKNICLDQPDNHLCSALWGT